MSEHKGRTQSIQREPANKHEASEATKTPLREAKGRRGIAERDQPRSQDLTGPASCHQTSGSHLAVPHPRLGAWTPLRTAHAALPHGPFTRTMTSSVIKRVNSSCLHRFRWDSYRNTRKLKKERARCKGTHMLHCEREILTQSDVYRGQKDVFAGRMYTMRGERIHPLRMPAAGARGGDRCPPRRGGFCCMDTSLRPSRSSGASPPPHKGAGLTHTLAELTVLG